VTAPGNVLFLSRPPGDGKTTVIKGAAYACCGVTLLISPTILLSSFMSRSYRDQFVTLNLDSIKAPSLVKELKRKLKSLKNVEPMRRYVVLATPSSLARDQWSKFFFRLGRYGVLSLVVSDEAHLAVQHGRTYRKDQYDVMIKDLFRPLMELRKLKKPGPNIAMVSATLRRESIDYIVNTILGIDEHTVQKIQATPEEMSRRDINIVMKVRQSKDATTDWKKEIASFLQESQEQGEKAILLSNFKSRIEKIREHVYSAVGVVVDEAENIFVLPIDGDDDAMRKSASIGTFCNQHSDPLCAMSRVAVISAATGVEGYDCSQIRLVFRLGLPTSLEQMFQEMGRIRKNPDSSISKYCLYPCVDDYVALRYVWRQQSSTQASYNFSVLQLDEVLDLITGTTCWAQRLESLFGGSGDSNTSCCGKCPYCSGGMEDLSLGVNLVALQNHLSSILVARQPELRDFVSLLWSDDSICQMLYGKNKKTIPRYEVEFLVLRMIPRGIIGLDHNRDSLVVQMALTEGENGLRDMLHKDITRWRGIKLL
jgi:superfamily II DNA helicase RecQ